MEQWEGVSEIRSHKFDHTRTANLCDWLPCPRAALPLVSCPHSLVYLHHPVVEGLIFCISATLHLGTSFPLFHGSSSYLLSHLSKEDVTYDRHGDPHPTEKMLGVGCFMSVTFNLCPVVLSESSCQSSSPPPYPQHGNNGRAHLGITLVITLL